MKTILSGKGISLPKVAPALAAYRPVIIANRFAFVSGQLPFKDGKLPLRGTLGDDVDLQQGIEAARLCTLNILAQLVAAFDEHSVTFDSFVMLRGYVASTKYFRGHPKVIDGASNLLVEIFGEQGKHARAAVGVASLPLGVPVEIEAQVAVREKK